MPQADAALSPAPPARTTTPEPMPHLAARSPLSTCLRLLRTLDQGPGIWLFRSDPVASSRLSEDQAALAGIEPGGTGRIRHFGNMFASQPQPQIVLRQQDPIGNLLENFGFVFLPTQASFGAVKPGKTMLPVISARNCGSASSAKACFDMAARIVPQDAGAQHFVIIVQKRRARASGRKGRCRVPQPVPSDALP